MPGTKVDIFTSLKKSLRLPFGIRDHCPPTLRDQLA